jgi:putative peptide zinc metalloprotease protein
MSTDGPLQSSLWYRVAALRPRLLARARLHRHRYRGELWYLLQDPASGKVHRFTPAARLLLAAMDGKRSVHDLWQLGQRRLGDDAPTQDEILQLLGQLHGADLLQTDVSPDAIEVFERGRRETTSKSRRAWANPMAIRIPLFDPGAFLDRHVPWWRRLWGVPGAVLWLSVVLPALVMLPQHWPELTHNLSDRVLETDNLLLLGVIFPLIKALHELGHATATRAGGGEVHDMGLMLLVLMPVPYVDASAATVLRSRWSRALVGAAGMLVEVFVAALAFYLWTSVEPGLVRALCFNVMLVAGVSTLIFNGNPLLRYDAYYILADLIEVPNLAQQAARYWGYLAERYVLRVPDAASPAGSRAEALWFLLYGLASTIYRLLVTIAIALFIGTRFFFIGVVLALWAATMMAVMPVLRVLRLLQSRPALRERRGKVLAVGGALAAIALVFVLTMPVPSRVQAEGVVWLPEQSALHAGANGFFSRFEAAPGSVVKTGQPLLASYDPTLAARLRSLEARVAELEATYLAEFVNDRARADIAREQLDTELAALRREQLRARGLNLAAPNDGVFTVVQAADMPGRYFKQGEVLGYVLGEARPVVRVLVEQAVVDAIASGTRAVGLRGAGQADRVVTGHIVRHVPAGSDESPSRALLSQGGGRIAADPRDPQGRRSLERVFQVDVEPDAALGPAGLYGQRVNVRFDLQREPLAQQWYGGVRRLFLAHFGV